MSELNEIDWARAMRHFVEIRRVYQEMEGSPGVNTTLALMFVFEPLALRYDNGERTRDLYDSMMGVE